MMIGSRLAILGGLAFCGIGLGALVAPAFSSDQYGLPTEERHGLGFVRALGLRDLVFGGIVLSLAAGKRSDALATALGWTVLVGVGDFAIVTTTRTTPPPAKSIAAHVVGTAGLAAAFVLVKAGI